MSKSIAEKIYGIGNHKPEDTIQAHLLAIIRIFWNELIPSSLKEINDHAKFHAYYNKGLKLLENNEYEQAIECFEQALLINHKSSEVLSKIGDAYNRLGYYYLAKAYFHTSLHFDSGNDEAKENLKIAEHYLGSQHESNETAEINQKTEIIVSNHSTENFEDDYVHLGGDTNDLGAPKEA